MTDTIMQKAMTTSAAICFVSSVVALGVMYKVNVLDREKELGR